MLKRPYTDSFLLSYSEEHVVYEIDMFFGMAALLTPNNMIGAGSQADAMRLNYAMIESFGIHLRNLVDFLYAEKPQPTDIVATDFCENWPTLRPPITSSFENARFRANKELAHLTTARLAGAPPEKGWDFPAFVTELRPLLTLFAKHARKSALSPRVEQVIR
jgi:hypothetical protein